jgi:hypothetical protein
MTTTVNLVLRVRGDDLRDMDLADLSRNLREELLVLDVDDVRPATAGPAPRGAKSGEAISIGALVVTLAPGLITAVVNIAVSWLRRQPNTVELNVGGNQFKGRVTDAQRDALVAGLIHQLSGPAELP